MSAPELTQNDLHRILSYDAATGIFTWRARTDVPRSWNTRYAGKVAGYNWHPAGSNVTYRSIRIFDWPFLGHRLAWLYVTGEWPKHEIDHRDLDGLNNSWANLRPATKSQNNANRPPSAANRTGYRGVSLHQGRYRAVLNGRSLGYRDTAEEAAKLYEFEARQVYGEYARSSR